MSTLSISIEFVHGYGGTMDRHSGRPDPWPDPWRLFAAMVSTVGSDRSPDDTHLLQAIESLPPPEIDVPSSTAEQTQCWSYRSDTMKDRSRFDFWSARTRFDAPILYHYSVDPNQWTSLLAPLQRVLSRIPYVGTSESTCIVTARLQDETVRGALESGSYGIIRRIPIPGSLARLDQMWVRGISKPGIGSASVQYRNRLHKESVLVLSRSMPISEIVTVHGQVRHALANAARRAGMDPNWIAEVIEHHGDPSKRVQMIPLANRGWENRSAGTVRHVLLTGPDADRVTSLGEFAELISSGSPTGVHLERGELTDHARNRYLGSSRVWRSVTPVVGARSRQKTRDRLIRKMCKQSGLPEPVSIEWSGTNGWQGASIRDFRIPNRLRARGRYHLTIRYPEPVTGPVCLGDGRHIGLGTFVS